MSDTEQVDSAIEALKKLRDEADERAVQSLETDETAYQAYERVAGRAQHFTDSLSTGSEPVNQSYTLHDDTARLLYEATIDTAIWLQEEHPESYTELMAAAGTMAAQNPELKS